MDGLTRLGEYEGVVMCDAYSAYESLAKSSGEDEGHAEDVADEPLGER